MNIEKKRKHEIEIVSAMIDLYCRKNHHSEYTCPDCQDLKEYAINRTKVCPFMENKTFCSACKVHCYTDEYRQKIKTVMRFSGPRLIFSHPFLVMKHGYVTIAQKLKANKSQSKN